MEGSPNPTTGDGGAGTAGSDHVRGAASPGAPGLHISAEVDDDWCAATGPFDEWAETNDYDETSLPDDEPTVKFSRTYCPLDTDGDGDCPIHTDCASGTLRTWR